MLKNTNNGQSLSARPLPLIIYAITVFLFFIASAFSDFLPKCYQNLVTKYNLL